MSGNDHGPQTAEVEALRREATATYEKLRIIADAGSTPFEHQAIGYAYGYVSAMLDKGHLPEARAKLAWMTETLTRTQNGGR